VKGESLRTSGQFGTAVLPQLIPGVSQSMTGVRLGGRISGASMTSFRVWE